VVCQNNQKMPYPSPDRYTNLCPEPYEKALKSDFFQGNTAVCRRPCSWPNLGRDRNADCYTIVDPGFTVLTLAFGLILLASS